MDNTQIPEVQVSQKSEVELHDLARVVGEIINPLALAQSQAQIEAIKAQDRQHERQVNAWLKEGQRTFWFSVFAVCMVLLLVGVLAAFVKPEAALYALTYFGGAISGYAYGRLKTPPAVK